MNGTPEGRGPFDRLAAEDSAGVRQGGANVWAGEPGDLPALVTMDKDIGTIYIALRPKASVARTATRVSATANLDFGGNGDLIGIELLISNPSVLRGNGR